MRPGVLGPLGGAMVCLWLAGCAGVATRGEPAAPAPTAAAAAAKKPEPPPAPRLDPRQERLLVKDLLRDVSEYYRLLKEKNVEQAATYVQPEQRQAYQDDLWGFVARYTLQSADVASYQLFPEADGVVVAKVRVMRTLFERASVIPERSEVWMTWEHRGDRWLVRPQQNR